MTSSLGLLSFYHLFSCALLFPLRFRVLKFPLFPDLLLFELKLSELFVNPLLIHLDPNHLHDLHQVTDVVQNLLLWVLYLFKLRIYVFFSCKDQFNIVLSYQCHRCTSSSCTGCTTHSMHVVTRVLGHVKV